MYVSLKYIGLLYMFVDWLIRSYPGRPHEPIISRVQNLYSEHVVYVYISLNISANCTCLLIDWLIDWLIRSYPGSLHKPTLARVHVCNKSKDLNNNSNNLVIQDSAFDILV